MENDKIQHDVRKHNSFLQLTANDYDMDIAEVEGVYLRSETYTEFYERLEDFIKQRQINDW